MKEVEAATGVNIALLGFWCGSGSSLSVECTRRLLDASDADLVDIVDKYLHARQQDIDGSAHAIDVAPTFESIAEELAKA